MQLPAIQKSHKTFLNFFFLKISMKTNSGKIFSHLNFRKKFKWKEVQGVGKRKGKCAGNGREKNSEKKSASVKQEELEVSRRGYSRIINYKKQKISKK